MKLRFLWGVLAVICLFLQYHLWSGERSFAEVNRLSHKIEQEQARVEKQRDQNEKLVRHISDLRSNPDAIEEEARYTQGLVKPDEIMVIIPDGQK